MYNVSKVHIRSLGLLVGSQLSMLRAFDAVRADTRHLMLSPFICSCGKDHTPNVVSRRKEIWYWMFQAAFHGCFPCIQQCIEVIGVDPHVESFNEHYTAMSWAKWGREKDVQGADDVIAYLDTLAAQQ